MKVPAFKVAAAHQVPFGTCFIGQMSDFPVIGMAVASSSASEQGWILLSPPLPETGGAHILSPETLSGPVLMLNTELALPSDPSVICSGAVQSSLPSGSLVIRKDGKPYIWVRYDQRKKLLVNCENGQPTPGVPAAEDLCFSRWKVLTPDANDEMQTLCEIFAS